jgi:hypothetical protein
MIPLNLNEIFDNGSVDTRMNIYEFLANRYMKTGMIMNKFQTKNPISKYTIMSYNKLSDIDRDIIQNEINRMGLLK